MIDLQTIFKRSFNFILFSSALFCLSFCISCNETADTKNSDDKSASDTVEVEHVPDSMAVNIGSDTLKVVPGESIGRFQLKQEVESSNIFDLLGKADSGDAAMCKSWSMWYWSDSIRHSSNEFDVYAACDPSLDMRKSIQILRLSGAKFITDRGISEKSTRDEVKTMFPTIQSFGTFLTPDGKEIVLLDDPVSGISFEFNASDSLKNIAGIVVYQPGSKLTDAYLPFYSLKK